MTTPRSATYCKDLLCPGCQRGQSDCQQESGQRHWAGACQGHAESEGDALRTLSFCSSAMVLAAGGQPNGNVADASSELYNPAYVCSTFASGAGMDAAGPRLWILVLGHVSQSCALACLVVSCQMACTHSLLLERCCAWGADLGSSDTAECGMEEAGQQPALPGQVPGFQRDRFAQALRIICCPLCHHGKRQWACQPSGT